METNVIKLKFINQGIAQGRAYTYFSNVEVEVDEVVSIDDKKQGIVTEINVPLTEIEPFKDKAKTILGKYVEETEIEEMEELGEELCKSCPCTDFGVVKINTQPNNMCEGVHCEVAYDHYIDSKEESIND